MYRIILVTVCAFWAANMNAQTYYVDSVNGNDGLAGTAATVQTNNGPWASLAKVNAAVFRPGDTVLFSCGSVWHESLVISSSGVAGSPITFGKYGTNCTSGNKPTFDGSDAVSGWTAFSGNIYSAPVAASVQQVLVDGVPQTLAHFPNRGYLPLRPDNLYLSIARDSPLSSNSAGSGYFVPATDLTSAALGDLTGAGVHIRINKYMIDDRIVSQFNPGGCSNCVVLDKPSTYQLGRGRGYYLDNKLWMLDQPGEWFYDVSGGRLYLWMPDGSNPDMRVQAGRRDYGIKGLARSYVVVDGLNIRNAGTGVNLDAAKWTTLRNTDIAHSARRGISADGASDVGISSCTVDDSGHEGIHAYYSHRLTVTGNTISNSGVRLTNGSITSLPASGGVGIMVGGSDDYLSNPTPDVTIVSGNSVQNSGYDGILFAKETAIIQNNVVKDSCRILDDCGAIYTIGHSKNSQIKGNIVLNSYGNSDGLPAGQWTAAQGIFLDMSSQTLTVTGNTVVNTDNSVQVLDGSYNNFSGNTFYGARRAALWFQQINSVDHPIQDNKNTGNILFQATTLPAVNLAGANQEIALTGSALNFFDTNVYSGLYSDHVTQSSYINSNQMMTLSQWQSHTGMDTNATMFTPFTVRTYGIVSDNTVGGPILTNGTFGSTVSSWTPSSQSSITWQANCGISGGCLKFDANPTGYSTLSSNKFSVYQGKTYLVELKLSASADKVNLNAVIRHAGPTFEAVSPIQTFTADKSAKRFGFLLESTVTLNAGNARLDIGIPAGQTIYVDNISIRDVTPAYHLNFNADSSIVVNTGPDTSSLPCPVNDARCDAYIDLHGNAVVWPITLPAYGSQIVVWNNNPFKDGDGDAVVDANDVCPNSVQIADVNSSGCAPTHLALTLESSVAAPAAGSTFSYYMTVTNKGADQAGAVNAVLSLSSGLSLVSASSTQGNCAISGATVSCAMGILVPGQTATATVAVKSSGTGSEYANASLTGAGVDTNPSNNLASMITMMAMNADTTPPTVSVYSPVSGSAVKGTISVYAMASDDPMLANYGISQLSVYADGQLLYVTNSGNLLAYRWNTRLLPNGTHALTVTAADIAGNTGSKTVTVTTAN